ncbi:MAG: carbohydrate kinase [Myxococcaceae bacterium]
MFDVLCVGEALVDFLPEEPGKSVRNTSRWVRCLGGAPANVTVGVARLGGKSALVGVVGDDEHGWFLSDELAREGVDVSHLRHTKEGKTGLAFVSVMQNGERSFSFHRENAAEYRLAKQDRDDAFISRAKTVHFGTNSLLTEEARATALEIAAAAKQRGQIVSSDPNLRLHIWKDPSVLRGLIQSLVGHATTVKLSEEEIEFVTGEREPSSALQWLEQRGVVAAVVTMGAKGAMIRVRGEARHVEAPKAKVLDTTGAGDGYTAGWLLGLSRRCANRGELEKLRVDDLLQAAKLGCFVGTKCTEGMGAVNALPLASELPIELFS